MSLNSIKLKILWHDVWMDRAPLFGVGEINEDGKAEKVFYTRRALSDEFLLYKFKSEEDLQKAIDYHEDTRKKYGGYQDHQPDRYFPALMVQCVGPRVFFDYYSHIETDWFASLKKDMIEDFYPPKSFNLEHRFMTRDDLIHNILTPKPKNEDKPSEEEPLEEL